jgi:septum formation inhibitor-activating ATPase MinD
LFGEGGGAVLARDIGAELLGQVPIENAVAHGSDHGEPIALAGDSPAAEVFRDIAKRIIDSTVPSTDMAGCSARLLESVEVALSKKPR